MATTGQTVARTVWLGQTFVDEATRRHVKSVIISAAIMGMATTAFQVIALSAGIAQKTLGLHALSSGSVSILLGLLVPCCGLFGATRSSSPLMCCFCSSNLVAAIVHGALMAVFVVALWQTDESILQASCNASCKVLGCGLTSRSCSCERGCDQQNDVQCCQDFAEVCSVPQAGAAHISCSDFKATLAAANVIVLLVLFAIIAPGIGLSAYAWYHGMMLWRRLVAGERLVAGGAVALADSNCAEDFSALVAEHPAE